VFLHFTCLSFSAEAYFSLYLPVTALYILCWEVYAAKIIQKTTTNDCDTVDLCVIVSATCTHVWFWLYSEHVSGLDGQWEKL